MRIKRPHQEFEIGINMTPIIDMVFLLLIFFLTATKFADIERDVRVKPPSIRHARPITAAPRELVVNLAPDGAVWVGGQQLSLDGLDTMMESAVARNPAQSVVVRGSHDAPLQYAVNVLDLCEKHGIKSTFLTTTKAAP
jgi:biopolymer transport protein ExbD